VSAAADVLTAAIPANNMPTKDNRDTRRTVSFDSNFVRAVRTIASAYFFCSRGGDLDLM
jgi:hypothetical protein